MSPNFSWLNLIINALSLASNEPDNPDIMLQFLSQLTGQGGRRLKSRLSPSIPRRITRNWLSF